MWAHGFRVSFTPLSAVLFTFPSRYLYAIGLPGVLSLGGWCRRIRTGFLRPRPTQVPARVRTCSAYGAVTRYGPPFQACSATCPSSACRRPYNPARASTPAVWALPLSLAATRGVTVVFLSSDYWDVSVRRVRLRTWRMPRLRAAGCPIRTPADQRPFAPPRRLSRPAASFFASGSQGILRAPCLASRSRLSCSRRHSRAAAARVCLFFVSAFSFPSCQRTARTPRVRSRGEQGSRTLDPQLAKLVL